METILKIPETAFWEDSKFLQSWKIKKERNLISLVFRPKNWDLHWSGKELDREAWFALLRSLSRGIFFCWCVGFQQKCLFRKGFNGLGHGKTCRSLGDQKFQTSPPYPRANCPWPNPKRHFLLKCRWLLCLAWETPGVLKVAKPMGKYIHCTCNFKHMDRWIKIKEDKGTFS